MFSQDQLFIMLMMMHYIRRSTDIKWNLTFTHYLTTYYSSFRRDSDGKPKNKLTEDELDDFFLVDDMSDAVFTDTNTAVAEIIFNLSMSHDIKQFDDYEIDTLEGLIKTYAPKAVKAIEYDILHSSQKNYHTALTSLGNLILSNVDAINPYTYGVTNFIKPNHSDVSIAMDLILDLYLERLLKDIGVTDKTRENLILCNYDL